MKKRFILSFILYLMFLCPFPASAAFDGTRPADAELLSAAPALIRANFNALKDMIDQIYVNYAGTEAVALKADKSYVDANFSTTGEVALKANAADVYTNGEIDLKFLNHYTTDEIDLKLTYYYTTGEVDSKLSLKLDAAAIASYYNKTDIDQLLLDKASTDAVALKADKSYVDTNFSTTGEVALKANAADVYNTGEINLMFDDKADTSSVASVAGDLAAHTAEVTAHGRRSPVGQAANVIEVTDGAGGWVLTPIAAASGNVTQAVDLVVDASTFSRLMNESATNAQAALNQIEANAATTGEVALKANSADVYTKTATDATIENRIAQIPTPSVNQTISVAAAETLAAGDVVSLIGTETITAKKTDNTNVVGICQNACDTAEVATVLLKGSDTNQSGMTIGENYYRQVDYSIGTDAVLIDGKYILIGIAKSSIEIILN